MMILDRVNPVRKFNKDMEKTKVSVNTNLTGLSNGVKSGLPIKGMTVIDCHGHLGSWDNTHIPKKEPEEIIETMDYLGIDKLCLSSFLGCSCDFRRGNDIVGQEIRKYPQRLIGYVTINPNYPDEILQELERCEREYGMKLVKIHPFCHEYPADGASYQDFWKYANKKAKIVLTHTWEADRNCGPGIFGRIAHKYAGVKIILGHSGVTYKGCEEAIKVARENDNIYLDIASSQPHFGMLERFVKEVGADKVLFGSDIPFLEPAAQVAKIAYAKISESDKKKILGINMKMLLEESY